MATPEQVRGALSVVTSTAVSDTRSVVAAAAGRAPGEIRAALFAATPLIVGDYLDGSSALALDWYEEIRDAASPRRRFTPAPLGAVDEEALAGSIAWATTPLYDLERNAAKVDDLLEQATHESMARLEPLVQKGVASGFWDTMTGNSIADPAATGWQRFASGGACKFCLMLAGRGAVYREATVNFAAHTSCHCAVGPSFDPAAPHPSVMQYVASSKTRTPEQQVALREYLNTNYPDAPG